MDRGLAKKKGSRKNLVKNKTPSKKRQIFQYHLHKVMIRQFLRNASSNATKATISTTSSLSATTNNNYVNTPEQQRQEQRPELLTILPSKRILNRILFDIDSQLTYKQMIPILNHIYKNLSTPESINLNQLKIQSSYDLMKFKKLLQEIRKVTNSINVHLLDLENELIEQLAELGNNDAITILAFETVRKRQILKEIVDEEDYQHANELIKQLIDINHPLVFKMAGDLSWELNQPNQAIEYWQTYIQLASNKNSDGDDYDDHLCQIYYNMGYYYFTYLKHPNLTLAKLNFQKCINHGFGGGGGSSGGNSNEFIVKSHFYLGQLYVNTNPKLSKYHWEISSSSGLKDSIINLGFLEMNCFQNYNLAIEWFKLGVELNPNEAQCLIGLFDAYIALQNWKLANIYLSKLNKLFETITEKKKKTSELPENIKSSIIYNESMLKTFHETRLNDIKLVTSKIV